MEITSVTLLDDSVISRLRSSIVITSLKQCLIELIYNALDADATAIEVRVDIENFTVQVTDNGIGIHPESMTQVAKRHSTSKCHSISDLNNIKTFGFRGEGINTTDYFQTRLPQNIYDHLEGKSHLNKIDGVLVEHSLANRQYRQQGTKVVVRNLFYKHPVRQKQQLTESQYSTEYRLEQIKRAISIISLVFPAVSFSVFNMARDTEIMRTKKCSSSIGVFRQLFGHALAQNFGDDSKVLNLSQILEPFEVHKDDFRLHGYISTRGFPNKSHQNIYINRHWVPHNDLYKTVEDILLKYNWDYKSVKPDSLYTNRRARTGQKYPIFLIQIDHPSLAHDINLYSNTLNEQEPHGRAQQLLREFVYAFLKSHDMFNTLNPKGSGSQKIKNKQFPWERNSVYQRHSPHLISTRKTPPKPRPNLSPALADSSGFVTWKDPGSGTVYYIDKRTGRSYDILPSSLNLLDETKFNQNSINRTYLRIQPPQTLEESTKKSSFTTEWIESINHVPHKISKEDLQKATVIGQVDCKYILLGIKKPALSLLFVDQHAADERIKLERMLTEIEGPLETIDLNPPIKVDIHPSLSKLIIQYRAFLERWGIYLDIPPLTENLLLRGSKYFATPETSSHFNHTNPSEPCLYVYRLPRLIADRCCTFPNTLTQLINDYLVWLQDYKGDDVNDKRTCPRGMIEIFKSKACRGAIMFNDILSLEQCQSIIKSLSDCNYPFQCAHGRPSVAPILSAYSPPKKQRRSIHWDSLKLK
ncbi:hypothetical protein F4703DRAFT_1938783 [Phycomyces blakesleeanus]